MSGVAARELSQALLANLQRVLLGKEEQLRTVVTAILAGGHILFTDIPGVGKTVLSKGIARSLDCTFSRLQCTADLLPSDVVGVTIYNPKTTEFEFKPGPVFSQVFLADEINRATPKAQSALLECMEERQVTVSGRSYDLAAPFMVLATQNPIEFAGTFPLPEAQLDRFMVSLNLGYPPAEAEALMLNEQRSRHPLQDLAPVTTAQELAQAQEQVRQITVADSVAAYIVALVAHTRTAETLALGASPRGSQALYRLAQARAAMEGRSYAIPDDVQALAHCALDHRLLPKRRSDSEAVFRAVEEALQSVAVPVN